MNDNVACWNSDQQESKIIQKKTRGIFNHFNMKIWDYDYFFFWFYHKYIFRRTPNKMRQDLIVLYILYLIYEDKKTALRVIRMKYD